MSDFTSDKKNLIHLLEVNKSKALKYISNGIRGDWDFFVMNTKKNQFQLLTAGQLQEIQNVHPRKATIYLEEYQFYIGSNGLRNAAHHQKTSFTDLWAARSNFEGEDEALCSNRNILLSEDEHYSSELDIANIVQRAVINKRNDNQSFKIQAADYLKINFPQLSEAAIQRITTLVNPDSNRDGGRPKNK